MRHLRLLYCLLVSFYGQSMQASSKPSCLGRLCGEKPAAKQRRLDKALARAVERLDRRAIREAIEAGANTASREMRFKGKFGEFGDTGPLLPPLIGILEINGPSEEERLNVVRELLDLEADINFQDREILDSSTALMSAVLHGYETIVQELLRRNALVDLRDGNGRTALDYVEIMESSNTQKSHHIENALLEAAKSQEKQRVAQGAPRDLYTITEELEKIEAAIALGEPLLRKKQPVLFAAIDQLAASRAYAKDPERATIPDPWGRKNSATGKVMEVTMKDLETMRDQNAVGLSYRDRSLKEYYERRDTLKAMLKAAEAEQKRTVATRRQGARQPNDASGMVYSAAAGSMVPTMPAGPAAEEEYED